MSEEKIIEVACGVLIREDGAVLIGSRPEGKPYAGYWEFPGGKLEEGETVADALKREFREELDMTVNSSFPWFVTEHRYEHGHVRLHFYRSRDFRGTPVCREGQKTVWMHPGERPPGLMLPKDGAIMNRVALPDVWEDRVDTPSTRPWRSITTSGSWRRTASTNSSSTAKPFCLSTPKGPARRTSTPGRRAERTV